MSRVPEPIADRLDRFHMPVTDSGCWLWLGNVDTGGYGTIRISGKMIKAHRASWMVYHGPISKGLRVLHRCDVPCCINPEHLFVGSQFDNMRDMRSKGREPKIFGEKNPNAKLSYLDVLEIRKSVGSQEAIARRYGIGKSMVGYIRSGKYWKKP